LHSFTAKNLQTVENDREKIALLVRAFYAAQEPNEFFCAAIYRLRCD